MPLRDYGKPKPIKAGRLLGLFFLWSMGWFSAICLAIMLLAHQNNNLPGVEGAALLLLLCLGLSGVVAYQMVD